MIKGDGRRGNKRPLKSEHRLRFFISIVVASFGPQGGGKGAKLVVDGSGKL